MPAWTEEELDIAFKMSNDGFSASIIGKAINKTRNSVLGMLHRQSMKTPERRTRPPIMKTVKDKKIPKPKPPRYRKNHVNINVIFNKYAIPIKPEIVIQSDPKTIMDLRMSDCRAIIGKIKGINTLYCASPKSGGTSWCETHRAIYTQRA